MAGILTFGQAIGFNIACAIATHIWYRHHEPQSLAAAILTLTVVPSTLVTFQYHLFSSVLSTIGCVYALYFSSLLTSISLYRSSPLHPLAKYPGPILCKLTKFWTVYISYRGQLHRYYKELHDHYGPIVRVGPNELSIADKDTIPFIVGSQGMPKGPLWEGRLLTPPQNRNRALISCRSSEAHVELRKPWNKAFGPTPVKDYEEILKTSAKIFMDHLESLCRSKGGHSASLNMAQWISRFTFDIMGDITFDHSFGLVATGDPEDLYGTVERGLVLPSVMQHIPWIAPLLRALPFIGSDVRTFGAFAVGQAQDRAHRTPKRRDFVHHLIEATIPNSDHSPSTIFPIIMGNAVLFIGAGADTTATALSSIVFYMAKYPHYRARLRAEIDEAFAATGVIDLPRLPFLPFLNAVINEALRLVPPVPTSLQRAPETGSGGHFIGTMFIPEGISVNVPVYTVHRNPKYFYPRPDDFWPERWLADKSEVVLERSAFIPFSSGPANCVGRPLAMSEIRLVISMLVTKFDMTLAKGYDAAQWENQLEDRFVFKRGELPIVLTVI